MESRDYYKAKLAEIQSKGIPESTDYYNQSFVDRMNEARSNIDNLVSEQDRANSVRQSSHDDYDTFVGQMKNYTVYSSEAENKFGVKTALNTYEDSKKAVAATQQALNTLPSSINRTSNVVLSQSQRELAYNAAADRYNAKLTTQQKMTDTYEKAFQNARDQATAMANQLYQQQTDTASAKNLIWAQNENAFTQAQDRLRQERSRYDLIQINYDMWQLNQHQMALQKYYGEINRYYGALELLGQMERADLQAQFDYHENRKQEIKQEWASKMVDAWHDSKQTQGQYMGDVVGMGLNFLNMLSK